MLFLILTIIVFNLIVIFIPKRISVIEMLTTSLLAFVLQSITDVFLDLIYHWYGYFYEGPELESFLYVLGVYPAINIVFLNFFPYEREYKQKILYIGAWSVFAVVYEALFLWSGTFYYNRWKLWYSAMCYPVLYITLLLFHKYVLYLLKQKDR